MRITRFIDCNPHFVMRGDQTCAVHFDCPEGHEGCSHTIPFTPSLEGQEVGSPQQNGAIWRRSGDSLELLTLEPSIRRLPRYDSREQAIAAGCIPEHVTPSMLCAFHGFVRNGVVEFCGDSR